MGCLSMETVTMTHESSSFGWSWKPVLWSCASLSMWLLPFSVSCRERERKWSRFVSSHAIVRDTGVVHCSVGAMLSLAHAVICRDCWCLCSDAWEWCSKLLTVDTNVCVHRWHSQYQSLLYYPLIHFRDNSQSTKPHHSVGESQSWLVWDWTVDEHTWLKAWWNMEPVLWWCSTLQPCMLGTVSQGSSLPNMEGGGLCTLSDPPPWRAGGGSKEIYVPQR